HLILFEILYLFIYHFLVRCYCSTISGASRTGFGLSPGFPSRGTGTRFLTTFTAAVLFVDIGSSPYVPDRDMAGWNGHRGIQGVVFPATVHVCHVLLHTFGRLIIEVVELWVKA